MTQTSTAAVTLAHLENAATATGTEWLDLINQSKTELEAIEAGMLHTTREQRALANEAWSAQFEAQTEIVKGALAAGVAPATITAITFRESW